MTQNADIFLLKKKKSMVREKQTQPNPVAVSKAHFQKRQTANHDFVQTKMVKQLKQNKTKHNKSYFDLNGGSSRGPRLSLVPEALGAGTEQPLGCWIKFPAWCCTKMTYNNLRRA